MQTSSKQSELHAFFVGLQRHLLLSRLAFEQFCAEIELRSPGAFLRGHPLPPEELDRWLRYVETEAMPLNGATAAWILKHTALFDIFPAPLLDFVLYHQTWVALHFVWKSSAETAPYDGHAGRNFPPYLDAWVDTQVAKYSERHLPRGEGRLLEIRPA